VAAHQFLRLNAGDHRGALDALLAKVSRGIAHRASWLLSQLCHLAGKVWDGAWSRPAPIRELAAKLHASPRSVFRWLDALRAAGLVETRSHGRNGLSLRVPCLGPEAESPEPYREPQRELTKVKTDPSVEEAVRIRLEEAGDRVRNPSGLRAHLRRVFRSDREALTEVLARQAERDRQPAPRTSEEVEESWTSRILASLGKAPRHVRRQVDRRYPVSDDAGGLRRRAEYAQELGVSL
jgi:DNA-binding transcriptional ArsR family regulator